MSFEVPMTLVGFTALSEEVNSNLWTPALNAASMIFCVPKDIRVNRCKRRLLAQKHVLDRRRVQHDLTTSDARFNFTSVAQIRDVQFDYRYFFDAPRRDKIARSHCYQPRSPA